MSDFRDATYDYGLEPGESFEPVDEEEEYDLSRPHIMTALGPVDPGALGFTLPHEHLIRKPAGAAHDLLLDDVVSAAAELEGYFAAGGRAIVDLTTADDGRDVGDVLWVAQHVPVHVVLATGYRDPERAASLFENRPVDEIAADIVREVTEGMEGTSARAGVIAAGAGSDGLTPLDERLLRAAAQAHRAAGAPIVMQVVSETAALERMEILREEGVDPARVVVGGLDVGVGESDLQAILATGAFVLFDRWADHASASDKARAELVKRLVDAGHAGRILVSGGLVRRSAWLAYGGGPGFVHFLDRVPLILMDAGLDAPTVRRIFVENPAQALTTIRPANRSRADAPAAAR